MKYFFIFIFLASNSFAYQLVYDSSGNVKEWGYQDTTKLKEQGYFVMAVKEDNQLLKLPIAHLKVIDGILVSKPNSEITQIENNKRKESIKIEIISLLKQYTDYMNLNKDGFDVSVETTTFKNKIKTLKQEYQSLP